MLQKYHICISAPNFIGKILRSTGHEDDILHVCETFRTLALNMRSFPCAKINLGLYVTERRPDGYHNLETVFYPIPLCDELEITEAEQDVLETVGIAIAGAVEDNLVMRTVRLLREEGFHIPALRIRLGKNIPSGAGLGGGSSDAAFTMRILNEMFHLGLTDEGMEQRISRLGADCAFFVCHKPVFATGIGDQFEPIALSLAGKYLLLVKPDDFVSTREAYANIVPRKPQHKLTESIRRSLSEWARLIANDFEESVFPQHPVIAAIKQKLYDCGAVYAAMSGSGSSVFGIFDQHPAESITNSFAPHFVFAAELG